MGHPVTPFYNSIDYCACLEGFGSPLMLDKASGCLLRRRIPGTSLDDLVFPYPMFRVTDEISLLGSLRSGRAGGAITATIVTDPLYGFLPSMDEWDVALKWKTHLIVDNSMPSANLFSDKVCYYSRRARGRYGFEVRLAPDDRLALLDDWMRLWAVLVERHGLKGLKALSPGYFERLFSLEGVMPAVLSDGDGIHGIHIWIVDGTDAYSHLHASDPRAYDCSANYLLYSEELKLLSGLGCRRCLLGSASGSGGEDGLFAFKRQFANSSADNHLLGLVMDRSAYAGLTGSPVHDGGYFPAYRRGELL